MVLCVLQSVKTGGVHAQNPVADGTAQSGNVQRLVFVLVLERIEALAYSLIGHRRNPQSLDRTLRSSLLHHPSLNQLTLLAGVTAVDYAVGGLHESLYNGKLSFYAVVVNKLDTETWWNHRQRRKAPMLPHVGIVVRFLQRTKMAEGPRHLVAITLHISIMGTRCAQYSSYIFGYTWFLGYTDNHYYYFYLSFASESS